MLACPPHEGPRWLHPTFAALISAGTVLASTWALKALTLSPPVRLAVALSVVPPLVFLMYAMSRWVRRMDELQRRIQAEALAAAFTGAVLVAFTLESLQRAGFATDLSWDFAWGVLLGLYAGALLIVSRRYA